MHGQLLQIRDTQSKIGHFVDLFFAEAASKLEPCLCLHQLLLAHLSPCPNQCCSVLHVILGPVDQYPKSYWFHDPRCLAADCINYLRRRVGNFHNHCSQSTAHTCVHLSFLCDIIVIL